MGLNSSPTMYIFTILTSRDTPGIDFHGQMQDVADVYAVDDYTVIVDLEKPNSRFHSGCLFWLSRVIL